MDSDFQSNNIQTYNDKVSEIVQKKKFSAKTLGLRENVLSRRMNSSFDHSSRLIHTHAQVSPNTYGETIKAQANKNSTNQRNIQTAPFTKSYIPRSTFNSHGRQTSRLPVRRLTERTATHQIQNRIRLSQKITNHRLY